MTGLDLAPIRTFLDERHAEPARAISSFADTFLRARPEPADDDAARREARTLLTELGNAGAFAAIGAMDWRGCCLAREVLAASSARASRRAVASSGGSARPSSSRAAYAPMRSASRSWPASRKGFTGERSSPVT